MLHLDCCRTARREESHGLCHRESRCLLRRRRPRPRLCARGSNVPGQRATTRVRALLRPLRPPRLVQTRRCILTTRTASSATSVRGTRASARRRPGTTSARGHPPRPTSGRAGLASRGRPPTHRASTQTTCTARVARARAAASTSTRPSSARALAGQSRRTQTCGATRPSTQCPGRMAAASACTWSDAGCDPTRPCGPTRGPEPVSHAACHLHRTAPAEDTRRDDAAGTVASG